MASYEHVHCSGILQKNYSCFCKCQKKKKSLTAVEMINLFRYRAKKFVEEGGVNKTSDLDTFTFGHDHCNSLTKTLF